MVNPSAPPVQVVLLPNLDTQQRAIVTGQWYGQLVVLHAHLREIAEQFAHLAGVMCATLHAEDEQRATDAERFGIEIAVIASQVDARLLHTMCYLGETRTLADLPPPPPDVTGPDYPW